MRETAAAALLASLCDDSFDVADSRNIELGTVLLSATLSASSFCGGGDPSLAIDIHALGGDSHYHESISISVGRNEHQSLVFDLLRVSTRDGLGGLSVQADVALDGAALSEAPVPPLRAADVLRRRA